MGHHNTLNSFLVHSSFSFCLHFRRWIYGKDLPDFIEVSWPARVLHHLRSLPWNFLQKCRCFWLYMADAQTWLLITISGKLLKTEIGGCHCQTFQRGREPVCLLLLREGFSLQSCPLGKSCPERLQFTLFEANIFLASFSLPFLFKYRFIKHKWYNRKKTEVTTGVSHTSTQEPFEIVKIKDKGTDKETGSEE